MALPWVPGSTPRPGYAGDMNPDPQAGYQQRNDWVAGPGGVPMISGSSGAPPGVPSPGFAPVDAGVYGGQVFAGRGPVGGLFAQILPVLKAMQQGGYQQIPNPGGYGPGAAGPGSGVIADDFGNPPMGQGEAAWLEWLRRRVGLRPQVHLGPGGQ